MSIARLHLITPGTADPSVHAQVELALAAGARWLQIRTKSIADGARFTHTAALVQRCRSVGATALVNDRVDLALAADADGVHLGLADLPVRVGRSLLGAGAIVGATCRHPDQARRAADAGASYLGVGPVYATTTKTGLPDLIGLRGLAAVAAAVDIPVIAISGITVERVSQALDAGAHGVAVVGAVFAARDVGLATTAFLEVLGEPVSSIGAERAS